MLVLQSASVDAQSRVRWGRSDPLNGITTSYPPPSPPGAYGAVNPPLDPYAMPPQGGLMGAPPNQPVAPPGFGAYPDPAFANPPGSQYPNGFGQVTGPDWGNWGWDQGLVYQKPLRLIQGPRFRWGWLYGRNAQREVGLNEMDVSIAMAFPRFLGTTQPLYVLPSFSLDLWNGPAGAPLPPDADLPGQTYAGFIDAGWESDRGQIVGGELGLRMGVWSDFSTTTQDSFRVQGKALLRYRMTPALSFRAGVVYVDRLDIKILPAGGLLWEPNAQSRFDFYFPQPKGSWYWKTVGNQDVWAYIMGEYGGDSWTIKRFDSGTMMEYTDRFDYNDIRLVAGIEWGPTEVVREGRRIGFLEIGWVTQRKVLYNLAPEDDFRMTDTVMVRAGFGY